MKDNESMMNHSRDEYLAMKLMYESASLECWVGFLASRSCLQLVDDAGETVVGTHVTGLPAAPRGRPQWSSQIPALALTQPWPLWAFGTEPKDGNSICLSLSK